MDPSFNPDCRHCGVSSTSRTLELHTEAGSPPIPSYWRCVDKDACRADQERDQRGWQASR